MRSIGTLPKKLSVNGKEYEIETDYRACIAVLQAMSDPDLEPARKVEVCLMLYPDFPKKMPESDFKEAYEAACNFLSHTTKDDKKPHPRIMDWEQDEDILFPAVNKVAGYEIRSVDYLHWWSFLGLMMSIDGDSVLANVMSLRSKRAKGKKLEKWEQEYWNANKSLCELKKPETEEDRQKKEELRSLFGYK